MRETEVDPDQAFSEINVLGTERLARLAAEAGVRRFLLLSTIKVNGEGSETVAYRGDDPPAPQDAYARSKWEAEQRLWRVCRETGLQGVVLRPPLVYGPGVGGNFLRLLRLAAKGWPLPFGCAAGQRSLLSVGNLADAIQRCLSHPAAVGRTFTLSDDHDLTTRELLTLLSAALGRSGPLLPIPAGFMRGLLGAMGQGAVADRLFGALRVDCREIRSQLDWTPPFSVEEAIQRTTAWFRDGEGESLRRS
jgi:UDP-glucose 4-epimerase